MQVIAPLHKLHQRDSKQTKRCFMYISLMYAVALIYSSTGSLFVLLNT